MARCVIIGAAEIKNYSRVKEYLRPDDFYIFCDGGLFHQKALDVTPNLIVGDFDSYKELNSTRGTSSHFGKFDDSGGFGGLEASKKFPSAEIIRLPCEKDDTDLFYAAKEAVRRGFSTFLLVGAIGGRFDHSLCNISVLLYLDQQGKSATILDDFSEMQLVGTSNATASVYATASSPAPAQHQSSVPALVPPQFSYFSLMCVSGTAEGVTIKNAKYPLENATISPEWQYAISNEVLPGKTAEITVASGKLLLVKVF